MTDSILFDLFGVIARNQSPESKDHLCRTAGVTDGSGGGFWDAYWSLRPPYDRGQVTGHEYWDQVGDALGTRFSPARVDALIAADIASWDDVDDAMVALIDKLAASGRRLALLSNIPEDLAAHYEAHHPWMGHFDPRAFSCRIGHAKPSRDAYLWCRDALAVPADRILFVDDRQDNIDAAQSIGLRTHLFTDAPHLATTLNL
ncbi:HAD family hydrolase [Nonomuraea sp. NPDC050536]|uniref:HAD family hydrolase n=1 Tax=Nonomuraea sp. NPDC050536 TaxID=3364366 RepID=UPI0037CB3D0F